VTMTTYESRTVPRERRPVQLLASTAPLPPRQLDREALGRRVRTLRLQAELSQEGLARVSGLNRATVSFVENGKLGINLDTLWLLCHALNVTPNELLGVEGAAP